MKISVTAVCCLLVSTAAFAAERPIDLSRLSFPPPPVLWSTADAVQDDESSDFTDEVFSDEAQAFMAEQAEAFRIEQAEAVQHTASIIDLLVEEAHEYVGTPYRYGGKRPGAFDCSGYLAHVFRQMGLDVPSVSREMAKLGEPVSLDEVQPGDLLFFKGRSLRRKRIGHVALVVEAAEGRVKIIHATSSRGVAVDDLSESKYFRKRYLKAVRLPLNEAAATPTP